MPGTPAFGSRGARMLAASVACGALGAVLLAGIARWGMPAALHGPAQGGGWTARSRAWFAAEGFYPAEVDAEARRSFSWTRDKVRFVVPNLDRSRPHRFQLSLAPGRPGGVPVPGLRLAVDGVVLATTEPSNDPRVLSVEVPARGAPGAVILLDVSNTFVPGPNDRRVLGVVVDDVSIGPTDGHFRLAASVLARAALAMAAGVLGLLLCGLGGRIAAGAAAALMAGFTALLLQDGAFIGAYVDRLVPIGAAVALTGAALAAARWRWPAAGALPEWPVAAGVLLCAAALKLALFAHPLATVGDGIFQVHRAALVHAGQYFFTSITPRPFFEFPYPVALYVAAQPFWRFFPTELDLVRLLRDLAIVADALVGLALYAAVRRQWKSAGAALLCAVLWPFARAPFDALNNANLTNMFGQSLFGVAMGGLAWMAAGSRQSVAGWGVTGGFLALAFLSHFSTLSVGVPILLAAGTLLIVSGRGHLRTVGAVALAVTLAAGLVSYGAYYSRFHDVYAKTIARVLSGEGRAEARSIVAPPAVKAERWITGKTDDYGLPSLPVLAIAVTGAVVLTRRRRREGLTLVLAGWALVWAAFSALGILSPVAMRVNLAAAPVFTCLAVYALSDVAGRSRLGVALAVAGALLVAWDGYRVVLLALGAT